jgi:hypothetical protein
MNREWSIKIKRVRKGTGAGAWAAAEESSLR